MTDDDSHETPADQPEETQGSLVERDDGGAWYKPPEMSRREVAKWLMAQSGSAAIGSIAISSVRGLSDAGLGVLQAERVYVKGTYLVNRNGDRLQIDGTLPRGEGKKMLVIPERNGEPVKTSDATTLLLRYSEDVYKKPTDLSGTANGYVAYSMVCTHAGCLVSGRSGENLHCPCHASEFAPREGAKVVGGPAGRPLPQLPIGVSENGELLVATGPFEGPIGPK